MKKSIFILLVLSTFLLLPFVTFSSSFASDNPIVLPTTAAATTTTTNSDKRSPLQQRRELPPVLDDDGLEIEIGAEYQMFSPGVTSGGIYLTSLTGSDSKCPNAVVQHASYYKEGMPVRLYTSGPDLYNVVRETKEINIEFSIQTKKICVNETVWKVADPDQTTSDQTRYIVTGGSVGYPGPDTVNNWFKIEKYTNTLSLYRLQHCPYEYACLGCDYDCKYVGVTNHKGTLRLSLTDEPFPIMFEKV